MSRYMSALWVLQSIALLLLSAVLLFKPSILPQVLNDCYITDDPDGARRHASPNCLARNEQMTTRESRRPPTAAMSEVRLIQASIQLLTPFLFALSLFSLWAFMRGAQRVRRGMARIFAFTGGWVLLIVVSGMWETHGTEPQTHSRLHNWLLPSSLQVKDEQDTDPLSPIRIDEWSHRCVIPPEKFYVLAPIELGPDVWREHCLYWNELKFRDVPDLSWRPPLFFASLAWLVLFVVSNGLYSFWTLPRAERKLSGSADTRPSQLWLLWLLQGLFFLLVAAYFQWQTAHMAALLLSRKNGFYYGDVIYRSARFAPPLHVALGLFSFMAMEASREWNWRAFSRLFTLFFGLWAIVFLSAWQQEFHEGALLYGVPFVLLMAGNLQFWNQGDVSFAEQVGHGPDGWLHVDLLVGPIMLLRTLFTRRRVLFERGVAAWGLFKTEDYRYAAPVDLSHDFFQPQPKHALKALVRFSTDGEDDAGLSARGVALQLTYPGETPFELLLSTGAYAAAENIVQFTLLRLARMVGTFTQRYLWEAYPHMREGMVASLRRAPDSYALLHYYSQTVRFWISRDGVRHLVRYRLVPDAPDTPESGIPQPRDDAPLSFYFQRLPTERRPTDYLKQEMRRRLEGNRTIRLRLEAQFHHPEPGDDIHWYNPAVDWRVDEHPWLCIGRVQLQDVLPDEESERLVFNPANVPPSLGIPISTGIFDYRSIADSEKRVHRRIQETRAWVTRMWGPPNMNPRPHDPT